MFVKPTWKDFLNPRFWWAIFRPTLSAIGLPTIFAFLVLIGGTYASLVYAGWLSTNQQTGQCNVHETTEKHIKILK